MPSTPDPVSSAATTAPRYEIRVCSVCLADLSWCAEDGEGLWPRAWCNGPERHLVIDNPDTQRDPYPLTIYVEAVVV